MKAFELHPAQGMTSIRGGHRVAAALLFVALPSVAVANGIADPVPVACHQHSALPHNLLIRDGLVRAAIEDIARRSSTFRQQLQTIAAATLLRARVRNAFRSSVLTTRAETTFGRNDAGYLIAEIDIPFLQLQPRQTVEYIAHELEHVIEQIEGLDLPALARTGGSGVYSVESAAIVRRFETERARLAGQKVEQEVYRSDLERDLCERETSRGPD